MGFAELKAVFTAAKLPATIASLRELYEFIKITGALLSGSISVSPRPAKAVKKNSIPIVARDHKDIKDENLLPMHRNASSIAGILGASTVSVMVMSGDGKQVALYNTPPDDSWIAIREQNILRSKYGRSWQKDPGLDPSTGLSARLSRLR